MNPFVERIDWNDEVEVLRYLATSAGDVSKARFDRLLDLANGSISMSDAQIQAYLLKELSDEAHHQRAVAIATQMLFKRIESLEKRIAALEAEK